MKKKREQERKKKEKEDEERYKELLKTNPKELIRIKMAQSLSQKDKKSGKMKKIPQNTQ